MDLLLLSGILIVTIVLFVTQIVSLEVVSIFVLLALAATGILNANEVFSGFSSSATITVAAMLIISGGVERTGVLESISQYLGGWSKGRKPRILVGLGVGVSSFSAFLNNTPIVAMLIPTVLSLSQKYNIAPSKLMLPLSYFAILGGTCTLIGTSTNILADSLYRAGGGSGFGMFEFTGMGLIYLSTGLLYIFLFSDKLLPVRTPLAMILAPKDRSNFVTEIQILAQSRLIGKTLEGAFSGPEKVRVLELIRNEFTILSPATDTQILEGDHFLVEGSANAVHNLLSQRDFDFGTVVADGDRIPIHELDLMMVEAVITPNSRYRRLTIPEIGLNRQYGIKVLALRRMGQNHRYNLRGMHLTSGDVLLIQGEAKSLAAVQESGDLLLIEGVEKTLTFPKKAPAAVAILLAVILTATLTPVPMVMCALGGVGLMLLTHCISIYDGMKSLDSSVLLLLAGTIPLGMAMEKTGLAASIATAIVDWVGPYGPLVILSSFYLLTSIFTEVISNNATVVLFTPIALQISESAGINPKALIIAIMFGASASFSTPIGYQTNTLVMGAGGYQFRDYLKFGIPLNLLMWLIATLCIPIFWPL